MAILISEITDPVQWDGFVTKQKKHTFLHAWAWGEFSQRMGDRVTRLGVAEKGELLAVAQVLTVRARFRTFLFVPHGPIIKDAVFNPRRQEILAALVERLREHGKREGAAFIRIAPLLLRREDNAKIFSELGFRRAPLYMHAENTWIVDIRHDETELLQGMRKNTRNLVRRAQREGVVVKSSGHEAFVKVFLKLYEATAQKHSFTPFSKEYIAQEVVAFDNAGEGIDAKVYLSEWSGKALSSAVVIFYGTSAFYHHGANSAERSKIPAAYLLQWRAMQDAKKSGKHYYNFWGIAEDDEDKKHPWAGLTFFKKGFGGARVDYLQTQDLPLTAKYWLAWAIDTYRRLRRGV